MFRQVCSRIGSAGRSLPLRTRATAIRPPTTATTSITRRTLHQSSVSLKSKERYAANPDFYQEGYLDTLEDDIWTTGYYQMGEAELKQRTMVCMYFC